MSKDGIQKAIARAGNQERLAHRLGCTQQVISQWKARGFVPPRRALEIESVFGVPRAELVNPELRDLLVSPERDGVFT